MNILRMKRSVLFWTAIIFLFVLCFSQAGHAEEATALFPAELTGDQLYEQGLNLCNQEKYPEAIFYFEEAGKRKSNFAEVYYQLGVCYLKTKQFDKSEQSLAFAKVLSQSENLKNKVNALIATIPEEIEKEKNKQEDEEKARVNKEYRKKQESEQKETGKAEEKDREVKYEYASNGKKKTEKVYYRGSLVRERRYEYYGSGRLNSIKEFKDGVLDGMSISCYENGQKQSETKYRNNLKDGREDTYDVRGRPEYKKNYKNGTLNGKCKFYYNGELTGIKSYDDGVLTEEENYKFGELSKKVIWEDMGDGSRLAKTVFPKPEVVPEPKVTVIHEFKIK